MLAGLGAVLVRTLLSMLYALVSEEFLKELAMIGLQAVADRTSSQLVKDMIAAAEAEWKKPLPQLPGADQSAPKS